MFHLTLTQLTFALPREKLSSERSKLWSENEEHHEKLLCVCSRTSSRNMAAAKPLCGLHQILCCVLFSEVEEMFHFEQWKMLAIPILNTSVMFYSP